MYFLSSNCVLVSFIYLEYFLIYYGTSLLDNPYSVTMEWYVTQRKMLPTRLLIFELSHI